MIWGHFMRIIFSLHFLAAGLLYDCLANRTIFWHSSILLIIRAIYPDRAGPFSINQFVGETGLQLLLNGHLVVDFTRTVSHVALRDQNPCHRLLFLNHRRLVE